MNPGDPCRIITDLATFSNSRDLLTQWAADRRDEGWNVLPMILSPTQPDDLARLIAKDPPAHNLLIGDGVPWPTVEESPDGHPYRPIMADYKLGPGRYGRVWFREQTIAGKPSSELYRAYLQKRHAYDWWDVPLGFGVIDYLLDPRYSEYEAGIKAMRAAVPFGMLEERYNREPDGPGISDNIERLSVHGRLFAAVFDGGHGEYPPAGFYNFGGPDLWQQFDPQVTFFGGFGSMQCQYESPNNLLMNALCGSHTLCSFYLQPQTLPSMLPLWNMLHGWTAGECAGVPWYDGITNLLGDPTVSIPANILTAAQVQAAVVQNTADIATIKAQLAAGGPTQPRVGGFFLHSAFYVPVGRPDLPSIDVTEQVQDAIDDGTVLFVYSDTQPCLQDPSWKYAGGRDPYNGVLKRVDLDITDGSGVRRTVTRSQMAQLVPLGV